MSAARPIVPSTRIIPMIGYPIGQVKSLAPINAWFLAQGIDAALTPVQIAPERVAAFFDAVRGWENCIGVSITLPHKQAAFAACDRLSERAAVARAVNIVTRAADGTLTGDMTDGTAFCSEIAGKGVKIAGCSFLLIGAGGAGSAIAHAMADEGAAAMTIVEVNAARRDYLLAALRARHPDLKLHDDVAAGPPVDVALNATPLGMTSGDSLPFDVERLPRTALIADAVTRPPVTPWLEAARARGNPIQTGEEMALAQLPIQLPIWGFDYKG